MNTHTLAYICFFIIFQSNICSLQKIWNIIKFILKSKNELWSVPKSCLGHVHEFHSVFARLPVYRGVELGLSVSELGLVKPVSVGRWQIFSYLRLLYLSIWLQPVFCTGPDDWEWQQCPPRMKWIAHIGKKGVWQTGRDVCSSPSPWLCPPEAVGPWKGGWDTDWINCHGRDQAAVLWGSPA